MKILLIYPYFLEERIYEEEIAVPPIGLYYIAALLLEKGVDVEILNWRTIQQTPDKIREILREKNPDLIGFSILNANRWGAIEIARQAKELNPGVKIVLGGPGATFLWEHLLTHFAEIDFVVLGEGEFPFWNLIRHLEEKGASRLDAVDGIAFRQEGQPVKTGPSEPIRDLDWLPDPAQYFTFQHLVSSRGCAWDCAFCGSPQFWGRRIRFHSPQYFLTQLERLHGRGSHFFYFSDDTFTVDKERVIAICRGIIERGLSITWNAISRVDRVDEEILYWMRQAGCIQISYGVESGSAAIRQALNKTIRLEDVRRAFSLTRRYGILARAYFIYGAPGETEETIQETLDLIREIRPLNAIFYLLDIFPGTALYERFKKETRISDAIWLERIEGILYHQTDSSLSSERILAFGRKLRTAFLKNVHSYAADLQLIDREELYRQHADFLSRLGLTFSHGDFAQKEQVREKDSTAEKLFRKALGFFPDHRAYLGLGILKQKVGEFRESASILEEALQHHPDSPELALCLGLTYLNLGDYERALACFVRFPESERAADCAAQCRQALRK
jgi:anaerobic magnesium-protoporphyrin IX monomethyl ester cyclase